MPTAPRVQVVVSGKFIALLLLALSLLGMGYIWYNRQAEAQERLQQTQERFKMPPYFVNRGASVIRSCQHCLEAAGKLRPQAEWKISGPQEIAAAEQRWFLAVEDPPLPTTVAGVLMLPVHPALQDNPALGFDQTRLVLVLYQNLQRMAAIEQPAPESAVTAAPVGTPSPVPAPNIVITCIGPMKWRIDVPSDGKWYDTGIPVVAAERLLIHPASAKTFNPGEGHWAAGFGDYESDVLGDNQVDAERASRREISLELAEGSDMVSGPEWLEKLSLCVRGHPEPTLSLEVELQLMELTPVGHPFTEPWQQHVQRHQATRDRAAELIGKP